MINSCTISYIDEIERVFDFPIDCKQGLYLSLLRCLGKKVEYSGARWPLVFYYKPRIDSFDIQANMTIDIINLLRVDRISELFNIDLKYSFFNELEDTMSFIRSKLIHNIPVLVNTDQYYIPYHYQHIYLKEHGLHTTLLMGFDDTTKEDFCFSTTPSYKGRIKRDLLLNGIQNSSILWCATLEPGIHKYEKTEEDIYMLFMKSVLQAYKGNLSPGYLPLEENRNIYTKNILDILSEYLNMNEEVAYDEVVKLCSGRWGWEIKTNINLFIEYLRTDYVSEKYSEFACILEMIEEYKSKWDIAFRKMYKNSLKKPKDIKKEVRSIIVDFSLLVETEKLILEKLITKE